MSEGPGAREPWSFLCTPRLRRLTTPPQSLAAQAPRQRDLRLVGAVPVRPIRLEHAGQALEPGLGEEHGATAATELTLADVGVAIAVGAQRRLRVVDVQRPDATLPDGLHALVEDHGQPLLGADVEARREEVA